MELYGSYTSPFARHCRIALIESELDFTFVETDAAKSAQLSPTQKVPFLKYKENGFEKMLSDSSAILKYIRENSGEKFLNNIETFNHYCMANTLMDSAINLFYLEKDGLKPEHSAYLTRQQARLQSGLVELNQIKFSSKAPFNDAELRIACFLDWALFRERITLDTYNNLGDFLENIRRYKNFASTKPKA